jgi:hypothetical protein
MSDIHHTLNIVTEHHAHLVDEVWPAGIELPGIRGHILGHILGRMWRPALVLALAGLPLAFFIVRGW